MATADFGSAVVSKEGLTASQLAPVVKHSKKEAVRNGSNS